MSAAAVYRVYPLSSVVLYNGVTLLHFGLATAGLAVAYSAWPLLGWTLAGVYLAFALGQMYVMMPLVVCPGCAYRAMDGARCVSALNLVSRRLAKARPPDEFGGRAEGVLCHNNLYMAALIAPLAMILPGVILNFSILGLGMLLVVAALLAFRYFVVFKRTACPHCAAKGRCPNAKSMGIA